MVDSEIKCKKKKLHTLIAELGFARDNIGLAQLTGLSVEAIEKYKNMNHVAHNELLLRYLILLNTTREMAPDVYELVPFTKCATL